LRSQRSVGPRSVGAVDAGLLRPALQDFEGFGPATLQQIGLG
jgi:hypothetical protein